ncbi:HD domain-containing phosphohydrolase [Deinococcus xianganensis]|uniref:HD domain-containing protein n=1 Tax=Deinococcus xianganensis TaxID=1507289 RepID=A0A6I4YQL1_9DEIO|nr:HD domain-containing protein [Deinococcus xianganensis]
MCCAAPLTPTWTPALLDELARLAGGGPPAHTWPQVLDLLVATHPGAQRALLSIRRATHFEVLSLAGYPRVLLGLELPLHTERAWYGQSDAEWLAEQPRLLAGETLHGHLARIETLFGPQTHYHTLRVQGDLSTLGATLLQPITLHGQVVAHLNLDGAEHLSPLPADAVHLLRMLIHRTMADLSDAHLAEHALLWEMARLGDDLRPIHDPSDLLNTGLRRLATLFHAQGAFTAAVEPTPQTLTEPCLDGVLSLTWTHVPPARHLAHMALRSLADRVQHAALRAQQHAALLTSRNHALELIGAALEARDLETQGHTLRVASLAGQVGRAAGLSEADRDALYLGALLHDLGKLAIPDAVLLKSGPLTSAEWQVMRRHPDLGVHLAARVPHLPAGALEVVRSHHERWDGAGYPAGLRGTDIPWVARLFAVIDTYDALTSTRPYRAAWTPHAAQAEVQRLSGTQLDPEAVAVVLRVLQEVRERTEP